MQPYHTYLSEWLIRPWVVSGPSLNLTQGVQLFHHYSNCTKKIPGHNRDTAVLRRGSFQNGILVGRLFPNLFSYPRPHLVQLRADGCHLLLGYWADHERSRTTVWPGKPTASHVVCSAIWIEPPLWGRGCARLVLWRGGSIICQGKISIVFAIELGDVAWESSQLPREFWSNIISSLHEGCEWFVGLPGCRLAYNAELAETLALPLGSILDER